MTAPDADELLAELRPLIAMAPTTGDRAALAETARALAALMRRCGLEPTVIPGDVPLVIGSTQVTEASTLLLYHHYDLAPPGPWRAWNHEPYQLAERDGAVFGRGVSVGLGPLVAQLLAIRDARAAGTLPHGLLVVAEGEALCGSPSLAAALAQAALPAPAAVLATGGERDAAGRPIVYAGARGRLSVRLSTHGAAMTLPDGLGSSVPNPLWRLVWALTTLRSEAEDVEVPGFYDQVAPLGRTEGAQLRQVMLDEAGRLAAWGLAEQLSGLAGPTLLRAEASVPTFTLSTLTTEPPGDQAHIPTGASARLSLQLVPTQQPASVAAQIQAHLAQCGFSDVEVTTLPGAYAAYRTAPDHPSLASLSAAGTRLYGTALPLLPLGPFAAPLALLAPPGVPAAALGLARHAGSGYGPNEQIALDDLVRHGAILHDVLAAPHPG